MRFKAFLEASRPALFSLLCALCLPCFSPAQQTRLRVAPPEQVTVKRGAALTQALNVSILPGFHINGDKPKDEFLIPLKLTWSAGPLEAKSITYPPAHELQVGADKLLVLTGNFQIQTEFKAAQNAPAGATSLTGKLRFQACNNQMCFRPASVDIILPVVVE